MPQEGYFWIQHDVLSGGGLLHWRYGACHGSNSTNCLWDSSLELLYIHVIILNIIFYNILSCYHVISCTIMLSCYFEVSYYHVIILSYVIVLSCYHVIMLSCYRVVMLSYYHVIMLTYYHVQLSCYHIIMISCYHVILLSYYHIVMLSYCHIIMLSYCHINTVLSPHNNWFWATLKWQLRWSASVPWSRCAPKLKHVKKKTQFGREILG